MKYAFDRQYGRLLIDAGIDARDMLLGAHLPEDLLSRREIMLTREEYHRLLDSANRLANDDTALRVATSEGIETFSPPIFAAYCSKDAKCFLRRFSHYKRLVGPLSYVVKDGEERLELQIKPLDEHDSLSPLWVEIEMVFIVHLIRRATSRTVKPLLVTMQHSPVNAQVAAFLGCDVRQSAENTMVFGSEDMLLPFTSRNDSMWQYMEPELRRRLSEMEVDDTMAARVRSSLVELLPAGRTTVDDVASKLCMSRRTLQRKLAEENTTFQQQLNSTRLLLAKNYLKNSERTSDDIAFLLGYEDTTSFLRAFNMWTGQTISEYKKSGIRG